MKIAVSSYSFSQKMWAGQMTLTDVIPEAKKLGFDGVEIVSPGKPFEEMLPIAKELKKQSDGEGMPICAYLTGNDFLMNGIDKEYERLKKEAEIAVVLGTDRMRHDATGGKDASGKVYTIDEALPIVADGYRKVTEFAAGIGIHTMIENHGYFFQDSERVERLIKTVNHPNFGWLVDVGNFMCADEKPVDAVTRAAKYAVHAHAKDFHFKTKDEYCPSQGWFGTRGGDRLRGAIIGHGAVNVPACLKILRDAGYDGWLSTEFEGMEECISALKYDLTNLREMLSK